MAAHRMVPKFMIFQYEQFWAFYLQIKNKQNQKTLNHFMENSEIVVVNDLKF